MIPDVLVQSTTVPIPKPKPAPIPGFHSTVPLPKGANRGLCFKAIEVLIDDEVSYDTTHLTDTEIEYVGQVIGEWMDQDKSK